MGFWEKYLTASRTNHSLICVGLDSELSKLPVCLLKDENPILSFNKAIIDATKTKTACYKPNLAFYLAAGVKGMEALYQTIDYIPEEIPVLLDCKTGDIGNTMQQYAEAFFHDMHADAITVNPLMGYDVLRPCFNHPGKMIFVLALTSNPTAEQYFKQSHLHTKIANDIAALDHRAVGAVVGATQSEDLSLMRSLMPETLFLVPGIGAQGGSIAEVMTRAIKSKTDPRILINSSRNIIFAGQETDFADQAYRAVTELQRDINAYLT